MFLQRRESKVLQHCPTLHPQISGNKQTDVTRSNELQRICELQIWHTAMFGTHRNKASRKIARLLCMSSLRIAVRGRKPDPSKMRGELVTGKRITCSFMDDATGRNLLRFATPHETDIETILRGTLIDWINMTDW